MVRNEALQNSLSAALKSIGVPDPAFEARYILSYTQDAEKIKEVLRRRATFEPLAKIFEDKGFYAHSFITTKDTLDPRPDSEAFMDCFFKFIPKDASFAAADFGVGSGCLLFSLLAAYPKATGFGFDISEKTLSVANRNREKLHLENRSTLSLKDCFINPAFDKAFDVVIANPPYLSEEEYGQIDLQTKHDPTVALTVGGDGLIPYRTLAGDTSYLKEGGLLFLEIGWTQEKSVRALFKDLTFLHAQKDLEGRTRILTFRKGIGNLFPVHGE